jgi:hypothetical protein
MSNPSKQRGTRWESRIVDYLREHGWPHAERRTLNGNKDRGDISGLIGVVIEAKDQARHSLAEWLDEAQQERANANADIGVVWAHRRGKASPAHGYVLMTGEDFTRLLKSAGYGGTE